MRLEPGRGRIVFDRFPRPPDPPFMLERPVDVEDGKAELKVFAEKTIIVIYVDGRVALSARVYDYPAGDVGLFVSEGKATFTGTHIRTP